MGGSLGSLLLALLRCSIFAGSRWEGWEILFFPSCGGRHWYGQGWQIVFWGVTYFFWALWMAEARLLAAIALQAMAAVVRQRGAEQVSSKRLLEGWNRLYPRKWPVWQHFMWHERKFAHLMQYISVQLLFKSLIWITVLFFSCGGVYYCCSTDKNIWTWYMVNYSGKLKVCFGCYRKKKYTQYIQLLWDVWW